MAKATKTAAPVAAVSKEDRNDFEIVSDFVAKGLGHGLVATEEEKNEIETSLEALKKAWDKA